MSDKRGLALGLSLALVAGCGSTAGTDGGLDARGDSGGAGDANGAGDASDATRDVARDVPLGVDSGGDAGGPPGCRMAYDQQSGIASTGLINLVIGSNCTSANCAGDTVFPPARFVDTPGNRRVILSDSWSIAELGVDVNGQLNNNLGVSGYLDAVSYDCGAWTLGGDHGPATCQGVINTLTLSPLGDFIYVDNDHDNVSFFTTLANNALLPLMRYQTCGVFTLGRSQTYNVGFFSAAAVYADGTGDPCPVPPNDCGGIQCDGNYSSLVPANLAALEIPDRQQAGFFVDGAGHERVLMSVGTSLVVVDLTGSIGTNSAHAPLVPAVQIQVGTDGTITPHPITTGAVTSFDGPYTRVVLGPRNDDHVAFVTTTGASGAPLTVGVDLGADGSAATGHGPIAGFPDGNIDGPWEVDGHRYAVRMAGGANTPSFELWNLEVDHATRVDSYPLPQSTYFAAVGEASNGVFFMIETTNFHPTGVEVLSLTSWVHSADHRAASRPFLDGPLLGGTLQCSMSGTTCYDVVGGSSSISFTESSRLHWLSANENLAYVCDP